MSRQERRRREPERTPTEQPAKIGLVQLCNEGAITNAIRHVEEALDDGILVDQIWNDHNTKTTPEGTTVLLQALVDVTNRRRMETDLVNLFIRACALGLPSVFRKTADVALSIDHYAYGLRICPAKAPEREWLVAECKARLHDVLRLAYDPRGQAFLQDLSVALDERQQQ